MAAELEVLRLKLEIARAEASRAESELALARLRAQGRGGRAVDPGEGQTTVAGGSEYPMDRQPPPPSPPPPHTMQRGASPGRRNARSRSRGGPRRGGRSPSWPRKSSRSRSPGYEGLSHPEPDRREVQRARSPSPQGSAATRGWFEDMRHPSQIVTAVSKCASLNKLCENLLLTKNDLSVFNTSATSATLSKMGYMAGNRRLPHERENLPAAFDMMARHFETISAEADDRAVSCVLKSLTVSGLFDAEWTEEELKASARRLCSALVQRVRDAKEGRLVGFEKRNEEVWTSALKIVGTEG